MLSLYHYTSRVINYDHTLVFFLEMETIITVRAEGDLGCAALSPARLHKEFCIGRSHQNITARCRVQLLPPVKTTAKVMHQLIKLLAGNNGCKYVSQRSYFLWSQNVGHPNPVIHTQGCSEGRGAGRIKSDEDLPTDTPEHGTGGRPHCRQVTY